MHRRWGHGPCTWQLTSSVLLAVLGSFGCSQGLSASGENAAAGRNNPAKHGADAGQAQDSTSGDNSARSGEDVPNTPGVAADESDPGGPSGGGETGDSASEGGGEPNAPASASNEAEPVVVNGTAIVSRLTQAELSHVLFDVLGDDTQAPTQFLGEDEFSPYDNDSARQTVSPALIDALLVLAEDVSARAAHDAALRAKFMPCEPDGVDDAACFEQTVGRVARLFLRREISDDELASYGALLDYASEQGDFYVAVELLLGSLIQDPEFLYRLERGVDSGAERLSLTDNEVATRMSFLLWGTSPDAALLDEAAANSLLDTDQRRAIASAMLEDPRAHEQLYRFHSMWLGYRALPHDAELNAAFQSETEHLIERVVFSEPSDYLDLFSSSQTYLTTALAEHYSLPAPDGAEGWVTYPEDSGRAGILSHGSVLSAFSKFNDTSPTQRGILVRTRLLCLGVPPPPATVNVDQAPGENSGECKAERYSAHREQSGCVECHSQFEPIGMGLENFDRAGRFRSHDDDNADCAIDGEGTLPGYGTFSGPKELAQLLLAADVVEDCFARQYLAFASSKSKLDATDEDYAQALGENLRTRDGQLAQWLLDFVAAEPFAQRTRQEGQ